MNKLAEELNTVLKNTAVTDMLSDYGKRMYVPNGIIVQSTEAKQKAKKYNATIGTALEHGSSMYMPSTLACFSDKMSPSDIFPYSPMGGNAKLREIWKKGMVEKNPSLKDSKFSLPVVCSGLTSALSLTFSLFADKGDSVVLPNLYWENYNLIIDEQREANKVLFEMFDCNGGFNIEGLKNAILSIKEKKAIVLLNFPNNPTGYTPTKAEAGKIVSVLKEIADGGKHLVVISDDAYFGLFFEEDVNKESLFASLSVASPNLLAIKCDGVTKEEMAWGFRVAFITYAFKGCTDEELDALVKKTMGAIRGSLSSCSTPAQNIVLKAMSSADYAEEKQVGIEKIAERYRILKDTLKKYEGDENLTPYSFNSGYFMSFNTKAPAENLRRYLLDKYGTGTICQGEHILRLAFSSVDKENIADLVDVVYKAAGELCVL